MDKNQEDWIIAVQRSFKSINDINSYLGSCDSTKYKNTPGRGREKAEFIFNYKKEPEKPKEKIKIVLLIANDTEPNEDIKYLSTDFDITLMKHSEIGTKSPDLILFTGGEDVSPDYYDEKQGKYTSINKKRDEIETNIYHNYPYVPKLGICRGAQFLTVMSGGKLVQHVENHGRDHSIYVEGKGKYNMTSTHHQMMYPFNMVKNSYELIGYSEFFRSKTYLNGNNEEIKTTKDFLESEIIYYPNTKSLCIQGHPEYSHCEQKTKDMCMNLIHKYLFSKESNIKRTNNSSYSWDEDDKDYVDEEEFIPQYQKTYQKIDSSYASFYKQGIKAYDSETRGLEINDEISKK